MYTTFNTEILTYERNGSTWKLRWYSSIQKKKKSQENILEEDMIVESPVGFFFDMEYDDKSFSDNISKSSIETNDFSINTMA